MNTHKLCMISATAALAIGGLTVFAQAGQTQKQKAAHIGKSTVTGGSL